MVYNSELGNDKVKVSSSAIFRSQIKRVIRALVWTLLLFFIIYVCFAATLVRVVPSTDVGPILTKNITAEGDMIPEGTLLVVDNSREQDGSIGKNLENAFIPSGNYRVVEVLAGPYGEFNVNTDSGSFATSFEGDPLNLSMSETQLEERESNYLNNEYITRCIEGNCAEGKGYIVNRENIVGEQIAFSEVFNNDVNGEANTGEAPEDVDTESNETEDSR